VNLLLVLGIAEDVDSPAVVEQTAREENVLVRQSVLCRAEKCERSRSGQRRQADHEAALFAVKMDVPDFSCGSFHLPVDDAGP